MFILEPDFYTVKDVARVLRVTPRAVQIAYKKTGRIAGVAVPPQPEPRSLIRIPHATYRQIVRAAQFL